MNAAVPQDPTSGPIRRPSIASLYSSGRLGAEQWRRCSPSGSSSRTDAKTALVGILLDCAHQTSQRLGKRLVCRDESKRPVFGFDQAHLSRSSLLPVLNPPQQASILVGNPNRHRSSDHILSNATPAESVRELTLERDPSQKKSKKCSSEACGCTSKNCRILRGHQEGGERRNRGIEQADTVPEGERCHGADGAKSNCLGGVRLDRRDG